MKKIAIARRYAKALLLLAKEKGHTEDYGEELGRVAKLMADQPELGDAVVNPLYGAEGRHRVLGSVIGSLNLSKEVASFLMLLFDKGRFGFLPDISEFYNKLADEVKGVAHAELISATELSPETIDKIKAALAQKTGKQIVLDVSQDPGLIGGLVTRIGDLVLDGSIKTQLLNMRESLKRGERV